MRWWSVVAVAVMVVQVAEGARILMLAPLSVPSHKIFFMSIADVLAARNHTVTYVTGIKPSEPRENIREVFVPHVNVYEIFTNLSMFNETLRSLTTEILPLIPIACVDALTSQEMRSLQDEEFDLVFLSVSGMECFYPYINKLQVPYIHMSPNVLVGVYSDMASNPYFSALMRNIVLDLEFPLTFFGRMINTFLDFVSLAVSFYYTYPRIEEECRRRQVWPENTPSFADMRTNGSLLIINSVKTMERPTLPYVPAVIHAGGIQCRPAGPLPKELEEWVAGAGDAGFIFFSLGSLVRSTTLPEKHQTVLLQVFASLEQRVLWKWDEDTMDNLPANVRLSKWLPQQDILGDPRIRLFISHGGLLSTLESTYHSTPMLGLPVFIDQHHNMRRVQEEGWGRLLLWDNLTYHNLRHNILDLIHDTGIRETAARRSAVMRDQPMTPGQWVSYWVEYVLRHRGAYHLRCPAYNMPWYQLYNVDVWLLVVVVVALVIFLFFKLVLIVCTYLCSARKRKQD